MKSRIKLWLYFGFLYLFAAFLSAGLIFAYDVTLCAPFDVSMARGLSFRDFAALTYRFLRPLLLIGLGSFTLFSCGISSLSCLYCGVLMGQLTMSYCLAGLNPFTHAAALVFLLGNGVLFVVLSVQSALHRNRLKAVVPDPKALIRDKKTIAFLYSLLSVCLIGIFLAGALYFFLCYFPL